MLLKRTGLALKACAIGTLLGATGAAHADVLLADWTDDEHFYYYINHMPDFDQKRCEDMEPSIEGLPGEGSMYCAPTATTNVLSYIASHGFPHIAPGVVANPESNSHYNYFGEFIEELGDDMDTDPSGGTGYDDYYNEIVDRLSCEFVVKLYIADESYSPDFKGLCRSAINGHLVLVRYGYYDDNGQTGSGRYIVDRTGGHLTTFVQGWGWEGTEILTVRDPATGGGSTACYDQSEFSSRSWHLEDRDIQDEYGDNRVQCYMWIPGSTNNDYGDSRRYLDGYISIIPNRYYSWGEYDNGIAIIGPNDWISTLNPYTYLELDDGWRVVEYLPNPNGMEAVVLMEKDEQRILAPVDMDLPTIPDTSVTDRLLNPRHVTWADNGYIWAADSGQLKVLDPSSEWNVIGSYQLPGPPAAMATDAATGWAYTIHPATNSLMGWPDPREEMQPVNMALPESMQMQGRVVLEAHPGSGDLMAWSSEARQLWLLKREPGTNDLVAEMQQIPEMDQVTDLHLDNMGNLLAATNGTMRVYTRSNQGGWVPRDAHPFNGKATSERFSPLRSSNNLPEATEDQKDNAGIENEGDSGDSEQLDCDADLNFDRTVDVSDLLALLSAWGNEGGLGDIVHDGRVDVLDLLELIEKWGQCD